MSTPSSCPDPQQYQLLLDGSYLVADQLARLTEHLEQCPSCADTIHRMQGADTFVKHAAEASPARTPDEEKAIERLAQRLKLLAPASASLPTLSTKHAETEEEIARLLTPPKQEGELGWLQRFRVLRVLGQGGMGIVLLAEDPQLPRQVALKVMRPSLAVSGEARRRFEAEARAMAACEHDHIVSIWDVDEEQGVPFLVMPLLRGESLEARLRRQGPLPVGEAVRVAREIALGLAAAHARGLIHRDIKPANIWLEEREEGQTSRVKLLDFGLVRAAGDAGQTLGGMILGTPGYMAPEQIVGGQVSVQSDLFSLGCVLYRLATGGEAFAGADAWAILRATQLDEPKPPHEIVSSVPLPLSRLILHLLVKNPANRPESALAVIQALDALTVGPSSASLAIPPTLTMPEPSHGALPAIRPRRRRLFAAGAAVAVLLPIVCLAVWSSKPTMPNPSPDRSQTPELCLMPPDSPSLPGGQRFRVETIAARGRISAIAFRPGTRQAATASADGVLRLWDAKEGRLLRAFVPALPESSEPRKSSLAWTADGKTLAWGFPPGIVYQIDPDTGHLRVLHENLGQIASLAWSSDGQLLAVGIKAERPEIRVWSKDGWLPPLRDANVSALAFSPNGKLLASGGTQIWDVESSKLSPLAKGLPATLQTLPSCLAWSPNGDLLAIGGLLWTKADGKTRTLDREGVAAVRWLTEGEKIVVANTAGGVSVYDVPTGKQVRRAGLKQLAASIIGPTSLSFNGSLLASNPFNNCSFQLWDAVSGNVVRDCPGPDPQTTWRVSPDGQRLLTATRDSLTLYETATGKLLQLVRHSGKGWINGFSPDGKWVVVGDWVREANTLKETHALRNCWTSAWSPQSDRLAYAEEKQKGVRILDLASKQRQLILPDLPQPVGLAWSPDGSKLALACVTSGGVIYDLKRGTKLLSLEPPGSVVQDVAWSPDGKYLAVNGDVRAWIYDGATGKVVKVRAEKDKSVMTQAFSRDSKHLATVCSDGSVNVWDTQDWKERRLAALPVGEPLERLYWSRDGKTLLATVGTGEIHSFDVSSGRRRGAFCPMDNARMLALDSSGHYSGSPNLRKHLIYIVQTDNGQQTWTADEFNERFEWKNDSAKVQVLAK